MLSDGLLGYAAECYGFDIATCQFIAGGRERAKQLYAFNARSKQYVLRFVQAPFASLHQTKAEMDWLLYLASKGVCLPAPLKARNGELAVSMEDDGETYIISAYVKMTGQHWDKNDPRLWNNAIFYNWGQVVGDMHRLTKDYTPSNDADTREEFQFRGMFGENITAFPTVDSIAEDLLSELEALPKDRDSYGLIHNDLHPDNFLIEGERIHLFDFDGCAYSWYAFDIGNALYIALWHGRSNDAGVDFSNDIIRYFLKGYLSTNHLDDFWLSTIPLFMMCCKIALFSFGCDSETLNGEYSDERQKIQMRNIENSILFTECKIDNSLFKNSWLEHEA